MKTAAIKKPKVRDGRSFARRLGVKSNADFDARKLIVLRTAARMFSEKGYSRTSIDDIADALGVTKPTIYHYGRSKDDLVSECLKHGFELLAQTLKEFDSPELSGLQKIEAIFEWFTNQMTKDFAWLFVRIDPNALNDEARAEYVHLRREYMHSITQLVKNAMADGSIAAGDPELTAYTLIGAFNFIGQWYRPGGRYTPTDISRGTLRIFLDGIRGTVSPATGPTRLSLIKRSK